MRKIKQKKLEDEELFEVELPAEEVEEDAAEM